MDRPAGRRYDARGGNGIVRVHRLMRKWHGCKLFSPAVSRWDENA
jgi:hypothetical protein